MTLLVPEDIASEVKALSARLGLPPEQLLLDALRAHFPRVSPELQDEFDAWERASDLDMSSVDRALEQS